MSLKKGKAEMRLTQFYRELFLEATQLYEPVWKEEQDLLFGYRWYKDNYPLKEHFQITDAGSAGPILMYTLVLPEAYLNTTIYEEVKRYISPIEVSIVISSRKVWLNASLRSDHLQSSLMGFINQARGELSNILDCVIQRTEERVKLVQV